MKNICSVSHRDEPLIKFVQLNLSLQAFENRGWPQGSVAPLIRGRDRGVQGPLDGFRSEADIHPIVDATSPNLPRKQLSLRSQSMFVNLHIRVLSRYVIPKSILRNLT